MSQRVDLRSYDNRWYRPGRGLLWRAAWLFVGQPLFGCALLPFSRLRVALLRCFGATIGSRVVIHSGVQVKYPWHLVIGSDCWVGEQVWIDNLTTVRLGNDVCLSQGAYLCTGNHDWSDPAFGLMIRPISLADGAWAGARSILLPGTQLHRHAVVAAGAVASGTIPEAQIYSGNPASFVRLRTLGEAPVEAPRDLEVHS